MNERVKELRKLLKLNMQEFGSRLGVTAAAICKIEKGNRSLTEQMIKLICNEYGINEDWLRTGDGEIYSLPEDEDAALVYDLLETKGNAFYEALLKLIKTYKELDYKDQAIIDKFIEKLVNNVKDQD